MLPLLAVILSCSSPEAIDGDSLRCDGRNLRMMGNGSPNVSGIDAPELRGARCLAERMLAQLAKRRLDELLKTPGLRIEDSGKRDRFGRPLVSERLPDGRTIGQVLIEEGLAMEWKPGQNIDWCEGER